MLVIGAGFGGLGAAAALRRAGFGEVTVVERADRVGGVWRDNTYPGAACDVPSPLYSWSWAPRGDWPRRYSGQADILDYLRRTADEHGLTELVRFGVEVTGARHEGGRWHVDTVGGEVFTADVLVPSVGLFSRPAYPAVPGSFDGPVFHSARWDHGVDLRGKRVAVIGTGASAVQFVPRVREQAARVTVFQRTPPWVVPKPDRGYTRLHHAVFRRFPLVRAAGRRGIFWMSELLNSALTGRPAVTKAVELAARAHLRLRVRDPELRAKLTPDYPVGCKRLLFSNDYLPALAQPNVDVVTERIAEITPAGVRTDDGVEHPADVVIYGTGFQTTEFLAPLRITGPDGSDLRERAWAGGARAHLGLTVPGFPNLFLMYGPNTNLGGSSIIGMLEAQADYLVTVLRAMRERGARLAEVRAEAAAAFDAEVQGRLRSTVWTACDSWYREASGRITTNWPGLVTEYRRRATAPDLADFELTAGG